MARLTVTNLNDAGAGSLRQAVPDANDGDLITFDGALSGGTINLASEIIYGPALHGIEDFDLSIDGDLNDDGVARASWAGDPSVLTLGPNDVAADAEDVDGAVPPRPARQPSRPVSTIPPTPASISNTGCRADFSTWDLAFAADGA